MPATLRPDAAFSLPCPRSDRLPGFAGPLAPYWAGGCLRTIASRSLCRAAEREGPALRRQPCKRPSPRTRRPGAFTRRRRRSPSTHQDRSGWILGGGECGTEAENRKIVKLSPWCGHARASPGILTCLFPEPLAAIVSRPAMSALAASLRRLHPHRRYRTLASERLPLLHLVWERGGGEVLTLLEGNAIWPARRKRMA